METKQLPYTHHAMVGSMVVVSFSRL